MTTKVLLADDSLTIQKVIKITLANEPFVVTECSTADLLIESIRKNQPQIVFLDFSLSELKTGYEIAQEIRDFFPSVKVLMMYGTFDTIEEDELKAVGVAAHIIKPFDSTKFVNLCRSLSQQKESFREAKIATNKSEDKTGDIDVNQLTQSSEDPLDEWTVDAPNIEVATPKETSIELPSEVSINPLMKGVEDWGIEIPGIIDSKAEPMLTDIPPIMSSREDMSDKSLPPQDDLEYPDVMSIMSGIELGSLSAAAPPKSKLTPLDDLNNVDDVVENNDSTEEDEERVKALEAQISTDDDLWSVEENSISENASESEDMPGPIQDVRPLDLSQLDEKVETIPDFLLPPKKSIEVLKDIDALFPEEKTPILKTHATDFYEQDVSHKVNHASSFDYEQFKSEIFNRLQSEIEKMIKDLIQQEVQQQLDGKFSNEVQSIAWEVIPNLAENLIREEIETIKKSIN